MKPEVQKEGKQPGGRISLEKSDDEQRLNQRNPQTDIHRGALQHPHRAYRGESHSSLDGNFPHMATNLQPMEMLHMMPQPSIHGSPRRKTRESIQLIARLFDQCLFLCLLQDRKLYLYFLHWGMFSHLVASHSPSGAC